MHDITRDAAIVPHVRKAGMVDRASSACRRINFLFFYDFLSFSSVFFVLFGKKMICFAFLF